MTAVYTNPLFPDAALEWAVAQITAACICSQAPVTREEAVTTYCLATGNLSVTGPFALLNNEGEEIGRYIVFEISGSLTTTTAGTASHVALISATDLIQVYACTGVDLELEVDDPIQTNAWCTSFLYPTDVDICEVP